MNTANYEPLESRHCTFSFFDKDAQDGIINGNMDEYELELLILKLWNMQDDILNKVGMELAQA